MNKVEAFDITEVQTVEEAIAPATAAEGESASSSLEADTVEVKIEA